MKEEEKARIRAHLRSVPSGKLEDHILRGCDFCQKHVLLIDAKALQFLPRAYARTREG